jgi:hypothetical protein
MPGDEIDWRSLFVRYAAHVGEYTGSSAMPWADHDPDRCGCKVEFTKAELLAMHRAVDGIGEIGEVVERVIPRDRVAAFPGMPSALEVGTQVSMADGQFRVLAAEVEGGDVRFRLERVTYWPPDMLLRFAAVAGMLDRD